MALHGTRSRAIAALAATMAFAVQAAPALAQDDAGRDMRQAIANCISNYRTPHFVEPAFQQTGFRLGDDGIGKFAEKGDVFVYYGMNDGEAQDQNSCSIFTGAVSLRDAHALAIGVAEQLFPNSVQDGAPGNGPDDCRAVSVLAPGKVMVMRVYDNGNGGTCTGRDGSSISISF